MERSLPIWQIHSEIIGALQSGNRLVIVAPTGAGKSTQVPQMLLDAGVAGSACPQPAGSPDQQLRKIVVLEPRRVAARTVSARVAWERGSCLGQEVGYQIRFDDQTSLGTRICYVTEGILLRWLQQNPSLDGISAVILDEFHERNLFSDVALAMVKKLQETSRPDLKLVVMSATLDAKPVADYLGNCPALVSEGQMFPVTVHYLSRRDEWPMPDQVAEAVARVCRSGSGGDILVFMPGMAEILAAINAVQAERLGEQVALIPLHGELSQEDQDRAFAPHSLRKVVVATNVAETSVTIDGICHVIDSGQARIARYDAARGVNTLFIEPISRASTEQRKGRAGRTAPGACYRLWTESGHLDRPELNTPEIQRADLVEVILLLHSLGVRNAAEFDWLDKPDPEAVSRAENLLRTLGALAADSAEVESDLTPIGRQMLKLPVHPRYSRILVEAARYRCVRPAALCAALVSGRDLLYRLRRGDKQTAEARELFKAGNESDFFTLMRAYMFAVKNQFNQAACQRYGINVRVAFEVHQTYQQILKLAEDIALAEAHAQADSVKGQYSDEQLLRCIMTGFVDQLCVRRDQGTLNCDLTEGRSGTLERESAVQSAPLFVAAAIREVSSQRSDKLTLLGLASAVKREWLQDAFPGQLSARVEHLFDRANKRVSPVKITRFSDLVIQTENLPLNSAEAAASSRCLAEAFSNGWFELPMLNHQVKQFIARMNLVAAACPDLEFPPFDEQTILECLARAFTGITLVKKAQEKPLLKAFQTHLTEEQLSWLDELAPLEIPWPGQRKIKLTYTVETADKKNQLCPPEALVKLHECFKLTEHPRVCEGNVPVRLWLCAPDGKRLESTLDWPAFKNTRYPNLRSLLREKHPGVVWI